MFAVIRSGGKQYKVTAGSVVLVEKLPQQAGDEVILKDVLMLSDGAKTEVGTPTLDAVEVVAHVEEQIKDKKVIIFKKKRRQNYRRKRGHRQLKTVLRIVDLKKDGKSVLDKAAVTPKSAPKKESDKKEAASKKAATSSASAADKPKAPAKKKAPVTDVAE